jgi:tetratricopeptide (TPR) repeat protein
MTGDRSGIAWALSSLGYVYPDLGQAEKGVECFLESVEICKEIGDQHILVYNYYGLADTYGDLRQFGKALEYANMALDLARELGAKREEGAATYVLATIHRDMGDHPLALRTFAEARRMLAEVGDTSLQAMIDHDEGLCLKMSGDLAGARIMLEKARAAFEDMEMGLWLKRVDAALSDM